jgi:hypothetical protein
MRKLYIGVDTHKENNVIGIAFAGNFARRYAVKYKLMWVTAHSVVLSGSLYKRVTGVRHNGFAYTGSLSWSSTYIECTWGVPT